MDDSPTAHLRADKTDGEMWRDIVERNAYRLPNFDPQDLVVDVGGNIGAFSYACLERGCGRVVYIEPCSENTGIARKTLAKFGDRVTFINKACSGEAGTVRFSGYTYGGRHPGGATTYMNTEGDPVAAVTLSSILEGLGLPRVRLLKIDCEGSEFVIMPEFRHFDLVDEVLLEYHQRLWVKREWGFCLEYTKGSWNGLLDILKNNGFSTECNYGGSPDENGMICAWKERHTLHVIG
jgi:FkbM family methyltransferase